MVNTIEHLIKDIGFNPIPNTVNISISKSLHQSKVLLFSGLNYFTNNMAVWQPESVSYTHLTLPTSDLV